MTKIMVVNSAWRKRKAFAIGAAIAAVWAAMMFGFGRWEEASGYSMPDLAMAFISVMILVWPIVALVIFYRRLPNAWVGLSYALGFGGSWFLAFQLLLGIEVWNWSGLQPEFAYPVPVFVGGNMVAWGLCRLFRGEIIVQDGTLCSKCGYSLIGNVSGRCPECGEASRVTIETIGPDG